MPTNKDLKRLVRARMHKTGEAYTAARANIVRTPTTKPASKTPTASAPVSAVPAPNPQNFAELAGISDAAIKEKTGCNWERWVYALDKRGAQSMSHRDIAALVSEKYKVPSWWSQTVTVGYERIKGLRARGQRRDGTYEATKSRTFDVPVTKLFEAWADPSIRRRWLKDPSIKVRTSTAPKTMRLGFPDGAIVAVGFTAKGRSKSSVALEHTKLRDRETADRLKKEWSERLDALAEVLKGE